jgi:hypothetical protein
VDLGSHFGLSLEGERDAAGRDEECLLHWERDVSTLTGVTHATLLARARHAVRDRGLTPLHETRWTTATTHLDRLIADCLAPLLAGGAVVTS